MIMGLTQIQHGLDEILTVHTEYPGDMNVDVAPVPASEYPTKAKRPENSRMSKEKLTENGFERLPSWQDALERYLPLVYLFQLPLSTGFW